MGFADAIRSCLSQYANAKGRAGRSEYWYFVLAYYIVYFIADMIDGRGDHVSDLVSLVFLLPLITAGIRRMHDIGRSGWYLLIPLYNLYLAAQPSQSGSNEWGTTATV